MLRRRWPELTGRARPRRLRERVCARWNDGYGTVTIRDRSNSFAPEIQSRAARYTSSTTAESRRSCRRNFTRPSCATRSVSAISASAVWRCPARRPSICTRADIGGTMPCLGWRTAVIGPAACTAEKAASTWSTVRLRTAAAARRGPSCRGLLGWIANLFGATINVGTLADTVTLNVNGQTVNINGNMGDVIVNGVSLVHHVHSNSGGSGDSGPPVQT